MKTQRTIPRDLEDWLRNFGASLEAHAFSSEVASSSRRPRVRLYGSCLSEPLSEEAQMITSCILLLYESESRT